MRSKFLRVSIALCSILFATFAIAQNKVVVIPLGGDTAFQVKSGQVLTGQLSVNFPAGIGYSIVGGSYPAPLPSSTPAPTLEYTTTTTVNCPQIGSAASGYLCVYGYNTFNVSSIGITGGFSTQNRLYGFALEVNPDGNDAGYFLASWAYRVP